MLEQDDASLPPRGFAGDDERGRPYGVRRRLAAWGERYVWAVPSKTLMRDRESELPVSSGRGRPPTRPWHRVEQWCQALDEEACRRIDVRDGAKGLLGVDVVTRCVALRTPRRQQGAEEMVRVIRDRDRDNQQGVQVDSSLSNAAPETLLGDGARGAKAAHRREECLQRSTSEAGLADYAVRN